MFSVGSGDERTIEVRLNATAFDETPGQIVIDRDPEHGVLEVPVLAKRREGPALSICIDSTDIPLALQCGLASIPFLNVMPDTSREARVTFRSEGTEPWWRSPR